MASAEKPELAIRADKVQGKLIARREKATKNYGPMKIIEVDCELAGEIVSIICPTTLAREFDLGYKRGPIPIGFEVSIEFLGEKPSTNFKGKTFKDFKVMFREPVFQETQTAADVSEAELDRAVGSSDEPLPFE